MPTDVETLLLIGAAVTGIVVGVLHLVGYVPPRYRKMLSEVQHTTAKAISSELEAFYARSVGGEGEDGPDPLIAHLEALESRLGAFTPEAVGSAVGAELVRFQESALKELEALPTQAGLPPEVTGAMGGLTKSANAKAGELRNAIGQGLLGPYGALLQQFMPPLYDYLTENPDMVVQALEMPVVQKLIQRASAQMGAVREGINASGGWG